MNARRTYRIYRELGLQLRNKTPKRRVKAKLRDDRRPALAPNETWAMDFLHDQPATGHKIRVLTIADKFSRYSPALDARTSYRGEDVVQTLERTCAEVGYPKTIRADQARSLSVATLICGLMRSALRSTSRGRASRRTMPSPKRSTAESGPNA